MLPTWVNSQKSLPIALITFHRTLLYSKEKIEIKDENENKDENKNDSESKKNLKREWDRDGSRWVYPDENEGKYKKVVVWDMNDLRIFNFQCLKQLLKLGILPFIYSDVIEKENGDEKNLNQMYLETMHDSELGM